MDKEAREEEERKEAAEQEEEDVEVEYNEVGAWEPRQGHGKKGKELEVSEKVGNRCYRCMGVGFGHHWRQSQQR